MKKIRFYTLLSLVFLIWFAPKLEAQVRPIPLWDNPPPFTKRLLEHDQYREGGRITGVAVPEIIVYYPPIERANQTAILICPGGGYGHLSMEKEGHAIARAYAERGYLAAVLKYRLPMDELLEEPHKVPLADAQQGLRKLRQNAKEWNIHPDRIGIAGFSAGGHLAASASVHGEPASGATVASKANFSILIYPVISMENSLTHQGSRTKLLGDQMGTSWENYYSAEQQVDADTPPAFLVHSWDDRSVAAENSIRYAQALNRLGIKVELHLFEHGGHGYGLGDKEKYGNAATWLSLSDAWIRGIFK